VEINDIIEIENKEYFVQDLFELNQKKYALLTLVTENEKEENSIVVYVETGMVYSIEEEEELKSVISYLDNKLKEEE